MIYSPGSPPPPLIWLWPLFVWSYLHVIGQSPKNAKTFSHKASNFATSRDKLNLGLVNARRRHVYEKNEAQINFDTTRSHRANYNNYKVSSN